MKAQEPLRLSTFIAVLGAVGLLAGTLAAPSARAAASVPCSEITTLRSLQNNLMYVWNPSTGDTMDYVVIGDGALSNDLLVMFNGTGEILPDWPLQLITNSHYSPHIASTLGYVPAEDGAVSLCHNYRLVLFDYPGVGESPLHGQVTRDNISSDVDAMLEDVGAEYGIPTDLVDPVGWSLGTTMALKYAFLSPASRPSRTIHNVVVIAGGPGGNTTGRPNEDSAACVTSLFQASLEATGDAAEVISLDLSELVFPYAGQGPLNSGTYSHCNATLTGSGVELSVPTECTLANYCEPFLQNEVLNRETLPWSLTEGTAVIYVQQRELSNDFDVAYCAAAAANFTSTHCTAYGKIEESATNGGVCEVHNADPNVPVPAACAPLRMTGQITVINGYEDLLIQWTYGRALVEGYNLGTHRANLVTYPGLAGHGVMVQHPGWTQQQVAIALSR